MRHLKQQVLQMLMEADFHVHDSELLHLPGRQVVNPLFSFLLHPEPEVRWRAVVAMGAVVSRLADREMESARVVVRRMMWQLNDESGGIGWGCPEALGECIAGHPALAAAYHRILVSYLDPEGNFLEHPVLQRGLLWGIGRAAHGRPGHLTGWGRLLLPHFVSRDPHHRGLAAWAAGASEDRELIRALRLLVSDEMMFSFFDGSQLTETPVMKMATEALGRLTS